MKKKKNQRLVISILWLKLVSGLSFAPNPTKYENDHRLILDNRRLVLEPQGLPKDILCHKEKQKRRKMKAPRRPPNYWSDMNHVERELRSFWQSIHVPIDDRLPPPVPSELLLNYFDRHDLRYAIAQNGGRQSLASWAPLIPGSWKLAVQTAQVQALLDPSNKAGQGLSPHKSPYLHTFSTNPKPSIQHKQSRQIKGYWTQQQILSELYDYLQHMKVKLGRPAVWMPRLSELSDHGRDDLKQAIVRTYKSNMKDFCQSVAFLTPYEDWRYFESQLDLFLELRQYIVTFHPNYNIQDDDVQLSFPKLAGIRQNAPRLHDLIMEFGGRKLVANKVGMSCHLRPTTHSIFQGLSYGKFTLDFGIELLTFIRNSCMQNMPSSDNKMNSMSILMPTTQSLLDKGEHSLVDGVIRYGGHENVARRLNLCFDHVEAKKNAPRFVD